MNQSVPVLVTKELLGKMEELFKGMIGVAQQGGEYLWPVLVKQQSIEGISLCLGAVVTLLVSIVLLSFGWHFHKIKENSRDETEMPFIIFGCILGIFALVLTGASIGVGIPHILNPEYYALQDLVRMVR